MLTRLSISNIVLIEQLNLEFGSGLNILTGETGAGKSILLDALALALGARSDTGLVRHGCTSASVTAEFDMPNNAQIHQILTDAGIEPDNDILILRRTLTTDGKSRAWINDTPVSVKMLKQLGDALVEIHGQFANHALLDPTTHRSCLDEFAIGAIDGYNNLLQDTARAYSALHDAQSRLDQLNDMLSRAAMERDFLQHNVAELSALNPQPGEEEDLATRRAAMMNAEKNAAILNDAITAMGGRGNTLDAQVFSVAHILERIKGDPNPYAEQIDRLYEIGQNLAAIADELAPTDTDTDDMDAIEERLFAIRAAARKYRIPADELHNQLLRMTEQLNAIDNSDAETQKLTARVKQLRQEFDAAAARLSAARNDAATQLRARILAELPDLKLAQADIMISCDPAVPSSTGTDAVTFMIKTNPGTPFAPLHKSASGGELARLMLALRVVLAGTQNDITFIFDEVDTGISGATASAVGNRLSRLAQNGQALVITHSAQVAGFADHHFKISKSSADGVTKTNVVEITGDDRLGEVARIISGDQITDQSLATARTLIRH